MQDSILLMGGALLIGFTGWWCTGIDDFIVFASILKKSPDNQKVKTILGLISAVFIMISIVLGIYLLSNHFFDPHKYEWISMIGGAMVLYIAYKIYKDEGNSSSDFKGSYFMLSFLGYFLNSTDDIIFSVSLIREFNNFQILSYFIGTLIGVIMMIIISIYYNKKIKDHPVLRASILGIIGSILFLIGLNSIIQMFL